MRQSLLVLPLVGLFVLVGFRTVSAALPPPVNHKPLLEARSKLTAAGAAVSAARADVKQTLARLLEPLRGQDPWKSAISEKQRAQADYDALRSEILDVVHKTPAYRAAEARYQENAARLKTARAGASNAVGAAPAGSSAEPEALTKALSAAHTEQMELESKALAARPDFAAVRDRLAEATRALTALEQRMEASLNNDGAIVAARKKVASAEADLADAQKAVTVAAKKVDDEERARQRQIQASQPRSGRRR